jgi:glutamate---cysteine ligase / carboxylate-amine ligase
LTPEHRFGSAPPFALGVEEELLLVDASEHMLAPMLDEVLAAADPADAGTLKPDLYAAMIELATPVVATAGEGARTIGRLRDTARAAGATLIGAGIHPAGPFGEAPHIEGERYRAIGDSLQGLVRRTPTGALHIHVSMPDPDTAVRTHNGLRRWLPLIQGLAANSPFWHGLDSGHASARAQMWRAVPRAELPRAYRDLDDWARAVAAVTEAGDLPDYTYLWWDVRLHPRLGSVEVRAMDAQSSLATVAGLAALIQGLARHEASAGDAAELPREALEESSFRAARDGIAATLLHGGALRPLPEIGREALALARPHAEELGSADGLEEVERILIEGGGADRQRAWHRAGGMPALLAGLVEEAATPYG